MTLIKSISGMRGTLGGYPGDNLTPIDIVEFTAAYGSLYKDVEQPFIVVGRDGRISGPHVQSLVTSTLRMMGIDVIEIGLSTTPTVEMEVIARGAHGGIIITASHNPMNYNALKFLDGNGEFISAETGQHILKLAAERNFEFAAYDQLGRIKNVGDAIERHVLQILKLDTVRAKSIRERKFRVVVDCINSTGSVSLPILLKALHAEYIMINDLIDGSFNHNPEPLEENLTLLSQAVIEHQADLGIAVDPDVDRLAFVDEHGKYCGEEYTLVMIADNILSKTPGPTVSNLSSTIALREVTEQYGQTYYAAPVGEVNVVSKMKEVDAVIGGEGNGGIIYPSLHSGRDALVGVALLLSALAENNCTLSEYRAQFPNYIMTKDRIELKPDLDIDQLLHSVAQNFKEYEVDRQDGVKIYMESGWAHLRKSNTEPIIRLYTEGRDLNDVNAIKDRVKVVVDQNLMSLSTST